MPGLHQLVVEYRNDLLSSEEDKRKQGLLSIYSYLQDHVQEELCSGGLDYLFEFSLGRFNANDCLSESASIISLIMSSCLEDSRNRYVSDLLSSYSLQLFPDTRLCLLKVLEQVKLPVVPFLSAVKNEKDPRCLMCIINIMKNTLVDEELAEPIFEAFSVYFPITFKSSYGAVGEEDLRSNLRCMLALHPEMAHLSLPFLNDKLANSESSPIISECAKALVHCYKNASGSAIKSYFRESTNLVLAALTRGDSHDHLYEFLRVAFCSTDVYSEYMNLVCDHIMHSIKRADDKLTNHLPSIIRFVAGTTSEASSIVFTRLFPYLRQNIEENIQAAKIEWACLLAFLCAISESGFSAFRNEATFISQASDYQIGLLERKISRKDYMFAISFIEALLRDPRILSCKVGCKVIISLFDSIQINKFHVDEEFLRMICSSVVKHQYSTINDSPSSFVQYSHPSIVGAVMSHSVLAPSIINHALASASQHLGLFISSCQLDSIDEHLRIDWVQEMDRLELEGALDRVICSIDPAKLGSVICGPVGSRLKALALPAELSSVDLLMEFKEDPEIIAALYNKHQVLLETTVADEMTHFCLVRAMILRKDDLAFEHLSSVVESRGKLLNEEYTRINKAHRFRIEPSYEQWFMDFAMVSSSLSIKDKLELLTDCSPRLLTNLDMTPVLEKCFSGPATTTVVKFINSILATDASLIHLDHLRNSIESLIGAARSDQFASNRHAALKCLHGLLSMASGAALLPFASEFVDQLKPALGDKKMAVREAAVECTTQLYSLYL